MKKNMIKRSRIARASQLNRSRRGVRRGLLPLLLLLLPLLQLLGDKTKNNSKLRQIRAWGSQIAQEEERGGQGTIATATAAAAASHGAWSLISPLFGFHTAFETYGFSCKKGGTAATNAARIGAVSVSVKTAAAVAVAAVAAAAAVQTSSTRHMFRI